MRLTDVQKNDSKEVVVTVRITKEDSNWMKKYNVSPSILFSEALKELQQQVEKQEQAEKGLKDFAKPKKNSKSKKRCATTS